ncbi:hypothetical protein TraAM80_01912 [Trypanosoma rangeli]|uniref:Uncharacterized protein n=1 Tax=Trypanosoma rangeli TaxID=5698 RepID=A0A3R7M650_TRYRA|nr:uncharacterized protein TraAM80_01912 [Trypanosoma rangeli]RNF09779.1 hypothetical protein TraAM80_01912 [Trypanosoma rangeli]|eukprot:RNF09779.1 hypothetical protein TraAM80_01912 [Trypanosoma rangeli]
MLYAQRKRRQQLAGKIGHNEEEYEVDPQPVVVVQHVYGARRFPSRRPDVNPISWQLAQQHPSFQQQQLQQYSQLQQQQQQYPQLQQQQYPQLQKRQYQETLQQRKPWFAPNVISAAPPAKLLPLQGNINFQRNDVFPQPIQFPSALSTLGTTPVLSRPAVVERSPRRFRPLDAVGLVSTPQLAPYPSTAVPCSDLPTFLPPTSLPPLSVSPSMPQRPLLHVVSPPRDHQTYFNRNPSSQTCKGNNDEQGPRLRPARGSVTPYPQEDDEMIARRWAREQAIQVQEENVRLCEERRLRQERERQLVREEERQQEELARLERMQLAEKERLDIEREQEEAMERLTGRKRVRLMGKSSETQLQEDLSKLIKEKKKRKAQEAELLAEAEGKNTGRTSAGARPGTGGSRGSNPLAVSSEKEEAELPRQFYVPQAPPFTDLSKSGPAANVSAALFPPPPPFSLNPSLFDAASYDPAVSAVSSQVNVPAWSAPVLSTPHQLSPLHGAVHYDAQLRDMITNHLDIQRTLESEVRRSQGAAAPMPPSTACPTTVPPSAHLPAPHLHGQPRPLNALPVQNGWTAAGANIIGGSNETPPGGFFPMSEVSPMMLPGILKTPREQATHITLLGVSPPNHAVRSRASSDVEVPHFGGEKLDELSAEPSRFVGAPQ